MSPDALPQTRPAAPKRTGQHRQPTPRMDLFTIPVNVQPDVAQFRAEYSAYARWLPPHLANVLIGAICTADAGGEDAVTTYEAISAATHTRGIQKRYKCEPVSPMQVERNMPRLRELGVLTWHSEKTRVTGWSDHYGEVRARIYLRLTIPNIERLYELYEKAKHEKAIRDADRAARGADYEQARNESRKAGRARNTSVTREDAKAINSCPTPNAGSSAGTDTGTDTGSSAGRIVPNRSSVADPGVSRSSVASSAAGPAARDDDGGGTPSGQEDTGSSLVPVSDLDSDALEGVVIGPVPGSADEIDWDDIEVRQHLAYALGMDLDKVWSSAWTRLKGMFLGSEHAAAIDAAAQRSAGAATPVAAFWRNLEDCLARADEFRAEREQQAAAAAAAEAAGHEAAEQAAREERKRQETTARIRRERADAAAEIDRLAPDYEALASQYDPANPNLNELSEARRACDPCDGLAKLMKGIAWYRQALAEREQRAPLAARLLEYLRAHPGTAEGILTTALDATPDDIREVMLDRQVSRIVRVEWRANLVSADPRRRHRHYYIIEEIA